MIVLLGALGLAAAEPPQIAVVVVDAKAREAGFALSIDGFVVDDPLPVDVTGAEVALLVPDGEREPLDVAAGEAWEITSESGDAWMSVLGRDVRTDRIVVRGPDADVSALAKALGAEVTREGDRVWLTGDGVLAAATRVDPALRHAIDEVGLVAGADPAPRSEAAPSRQASRIPVADARTAITASSVVPSPSRSAPVPERERTAPVASPAEAAPPVAAPVDVGPDADEALAERYAGTYLCSGVPLWLHPSGIYRGAGLRGRWKVSAPGVVRLEDFSGELQLRAAVRTDDRVCVGLWGPAL